MESKFSKRRILKNILWLFCVREIEEVWIPTSALTEVRNGNQQSDAKRKKQTAKVIPGLEEKVEDENFQKEACTFNASDCFVSEMILTEKFKKLRDLSDMNAIEKNALIGIYPSIRTCFLEKIIFLCNSADFSLENIKNCFFHSVFSNSDFEMRITMLYGLYLFDSKVVHNMDLIGGLLQIILEDTKIGLFFLLSHAAGLTALRKQMRTERSSENLHFWILAASFEKAPRHFKPQYARQIIELYFSKNSDHPLTVSFATQQEINQASENQTSPDLFQRAQKEVFFTIQHGPYLRMIQQDAVLKKLKSDLYGEISHLYSKSLYNIMAGSSTSDNTLKMRRRKESIVETNRGR